MGSTVSASPEHRGCVEKAEVLGEAWAALNRLDQDSMLGMRDDAMILVMGSTDHRTPERPL